MMYKKIKFYCMCHRGSLDEALKTKIQIFEDEFKSIFKKYNFEYYCFDERINCIRFIKGDLEKNLNVPEWLLIELVDSR